MMQTTLTLDDATAKALHRFTAEGGFASPEAALAALLQAQEPADTDLEDWLQQVVLARHDQDVAGAARISVAAARARLLGAG